MARIHIVNFCQIAVFCGCFALLLVVCDDTFQVPSLFGDDTEDHIIMATSSEPGLHKTNPHNTDLILASLKVVTLFDTGTEIDVLLTKLRDRTILHVPKEGTVELPHRFGTPPLTFEDMPDFGLGIDSDGTLKTYCWLLSYRPEVVQLRMVNVKHLRARFIVGPLTELDARNMPLTQLLGPQDTESERDVENEKLY